MEDKAEKDQSLEQKPVETNTSIQPHSAPESSLSTSISSTVNEDQTEEDDDFHISVKSFLIAMALLAVALGGLFYYSNLDEHVAVKKFTNVYSFVPSKISKSAPISINLPDGVSEDVAKSSISFSPDLEGEWLLEEEEGVVVFIPQQPLRTGVYYAVNLDTGSIQMSGDFFVDEDPKIQAVFPGSDTESHEDSEITIVFNRPMVPLTTLNEQESVELPITISPDTPGQFKWISTRNLQFIPETTLIPSSDYTVKIGAGLRSVDGLPVAPLEHEFVTRPLRYEYVSSASLGYRSPIMINFNQPIDIDKTKRQITVTNQAGEKINVEYKYGETTYYNRTERKYVTEDDPSKIFILQSRDKHGRKELWDFDTTYKVSITGATPLAGNRDLNEGRNSTVYVPNIVKSVDAESDRSSHVRPDLFDPQGTLVVQFYEDIDKDKSDFNIKGLNNVEYGERCKTDEGGNTIRLGSGCVMEEDWSTLRLTFNAGAFSTNEDFQLKLESIRTTDGFKINAEPISLPVRTYPDLQVYRTLPNNGEQWASPGGGIYICTNVPLEPPVEGFVDEFISTDGYIIYGKMQRSFFIERKSRWDECNTGEFQTWFQYGITPETNYTLDISITSEFGQTANQVIGFKTGTVESKYTRFFNLQKQYNVTTPDRTNLAYAAENLEYVDMHICRLEPETFLQRTVDRDDKSDPPNNTGCTQVISEQVLLPSRYWVKNYFQLDLANYFTDTRGHYVITFSNPNFTFGDYYSRSAEKIYDRTYVSVTNLAVGQKEIEDVTSPYSQSTNPGSSNVLESSIANSSNLYWVNNNNTLASVNGSSVTQYTGGYNRNFVRGSSGFTNYQGIANLDIEPNLVGAVVRSGLDTAVVTDWSDTLESSGSVRDASRTYIYTDRPIYRPGHTVHIRGIDRIGFDGEYEVWNEEEAELEVFDSQGKSIYQTRLAQSDYGTFNTEFELPGDAPLGTYRIVVFNQTAQFDVEEYVPAAFKLEASANQEEYINGETMQIEVKADYYFGVPLSEGSVTYSVTAQDYHFDRYQDEYFNFGGGWYYCYYCGYGDDFLFRGEATINEQGQAYIERDLNLADYFDDVDSEGSKIITVSITAKDINGRSVSTQKSFILHKGEFYLGSKTSRYYTSKDTPITLKVKTVDVEGKPQSVSGIKQSVYKVSWESYRRQEVDGGFYYRSNKKLDEISSDRISTDRQGNYSGELSFAEEGSYEIHTEKEDDRGNLMKSISRLYIYGSKPISVPPNNNYELDLEVERSSLEVGETASLLIKSPYERAKVLIAVERGTVYDYWIKDVTGGLHLHEFPIKSEYAPNIFVSALLISPDPEVKYGSVRYEIGNSENELTVEVKSNKTHYLPGEEVILDVKTTNHKNEPVSAEVSLAVADLSVLALKGNPKKNPALFFYDGFPLSVSTASNLKNILYEVDIPLGTKGGGGSGDPDDLAKKKRGLFKDTAFWQADVVTDQFGQASVSFTLPDNLTTWQIEGLGVTKDTKLGVDYEEFTTKKDLMAVPLKPRFVIPGDKFYLGAQVFNQTDRGRTVKVELESDTLVFVEDKQDEVFINDGETKTVYFEVVAPTDIKAGQHNFNFTASDESFVDSVDQVIPITPNNTFETVATTHFTNQDQAIEYVYIPDEVLSGDGGLTVNTNATMAVFMTDALSYMVTYPYGCSEQLASSLSTIGTLTSALKLPNVEGDLDTIEHLGVTYTVDEVVKNGLNRIYENQTWGGGFSYYKGLRPHLSLTMHVVTALIKLKEAGYEVRDDVIERAANYIEAEARREYDKYPSLNQERVILAEYVLRLVNGSKETSLSSIIDSLINDKAFLNEKISSMSLAYLAILTSEGYSRSNRTQVYDALQNRIDIDGRGAYLSTIETVSRYYFETPVKNTALLLKAFAAHEDEHVAMSNVLRWLLASRDKNGVWGSTHNTFVVVDAMTDYLKWQRESESNFSLRGLLDGDELFQHEFSSSNIFETFTKKVAIDDLEREKLLPLLFEKENLNDLNNNFYYDMSLKYFLPAQSLPPRDEGVTVVRELYRLDDEREKDPISSATVGEVVKGKITLTIPDFYTHVAIEDMIPAGFEIVNFNLATEDQSLQDNNAKGYLDDSENSGWLSGIRNVLGESQSAQVFRSRGFGGSYGNESRKLHPTHIESHDDRVFLYVEELPEGVYEYEYFLRALVPGEFQHLPARAEELFFPEVFGRTGGNIINVNPE